MTAALVAIFTLVLGLVCGLLFGRATNTPYQEAKELKESLEAVQHELETYKSEVTQHFTKTAELVNEMTDNYRNVHSHLAGGAQTLCAGALQLESMGSSTEALEAQAEEVTEVNAEERAETTTVEAVTSAASSEDTAAETTAETAIAEDASSANVEQIKVNADIVNGETVTAVATESSETVPAELVADAAAAEQKRTEERVH